MATTREPELRQTKEVWKVLETTRLPRLVKDLVRHVLWKKVGEWMESIGIRNTNKCPGCTRVADNEHRVKQCPHLAVPIPLTRDLCHPIKYGQDKIFEPLGICLEHQRISLETEQGLLMWTAVTAGKKPFSSFLEPQTAKKYLP